MAQRLALGFLAAAALVILAGCLIGGATAAIGFALVAGAFPFALMALGVSGGARRGGALLTVALLLATIELALVGMLLLRGRVLDGPWAGGLPLAAALQIYGIFLLPLVVTAVGFALTFRGFDVGERDLERLRTVAPEEPR